MPRKTGNTGTTFGVKFRLGFDMERLRLQASSDRWAHNELLETLKKEYKQQGWVNCTRGRIGAWYTMMRKKHPFLRQTTSYISRAVLFELGRHYAQYVETERLKAAGETPRAEFGEPGFRVYGEAISIPLMIRDHGGSARFDGHRTVSIHKMGTVYLSREFPMLNFRAKVGTLYQTRDGKWRMGISCEVDVEERKAPVEPKPAGVDRNVGNVATGDMVLELPEKVEKEMKKLEKSAKHWQRTMERRQGPDRKNKTPPSNRYEEARKTYASRMRKLANIRKNAVYKVANVLKDAGVTHAVVENIKPKDMTKSAKGTKENPGRNVAQKRGLNRAIQNQGWGLLVMVLSYMLSGGVIRVNPAYTSQTCSLCLHVDKNNRWRRLFRCMSCGFVQHADVNAGCNIENRGRSVLGLPRRTIESLKEVPASAGPAPGIGLQDVEGGVTAGRACRGGCGHSAKRQAWTEVEGVVSERARVVRLWDDV